MHISGAYDVAGPPGAPTIVFLHGLRVTRRMWAPQMEQLRDKYQVVAVDLPGHGALREIEFSLEGAVEKVAEIIERTAGGRALVVGLSLGGYVAMEFGARYPAKAIGLVIASASVEPSGWYNLPYRWMAWMFENVPEEWTAWVNRTVFETIYRRELSALLVEPGFFMRGGSQALHEVFAQKFRPRLAAYPGPALLLNGAYDLGFRLQEQKFLAATQRGLLEIIPKAIHISNLDQPEAFSNAIRRFAASIGW
jgi:pimeloyl-ACP methyl ester carboxylesterase